ncbi:hypothetical protein PM082_016656 [Marasmius tenuissimus]|nr:hypothetical protein PM082_016656 [Marasmius tenuissimus]
MEITYYQINHFPYNKLATNICSFVWLTSAANFNIANFVEWRIDCNREASIILTKPHREFKLKPLQIQVDSKGTAQSFLVAAFSRELPTSTAKLDPPYQVRQVKGLGFHNIAAPVPFYTFENN